MTQSFMDHYDVEKDLSKPIVEYSRYVLSKGTEGEMLVLSNGIMTKLEIKQGLLLVRK